MRTIANMLVMHTMMESGQKIPEDLEEGAKHFSDIMNSLLGNGNSPLNWRKERDVFIGSCKKLVGASKEVIEHTDISYEDLASGIAESISSNEFPETLERKAAPTVVEAEPEQEDEPEEEEVVEEAPVVEEPVVESKPEAPKEVAEPVAEKKPDEVVDTPAATEETSPVAENEDTRGRGGRGRGRGPRPDRGTRGDFRGGERGAFRGERGAYRGERGMRGDRGDRGRGGGRGRGQNWRGRNGEDNEGFITVKEDGDKDTRGRGRGYRGRGDRGAWRGSGEAGEGTYRGNYRGDRGDRGGPRPPRGDRPPRTRGAPKEGDLPGVATAAADPTPVSDLKME